jgi:acyl carrier protein
MKENEFIELLTETIDTEDEIGVDTLLEEIEEYDSIAVLSLMSMYDELSIKVSPDDFKDLKTVADLVKLAGDKIA